MESLYFNCNLHGLIEELKKYASEKEIQGFISDMDAFSVYESLKSKRVFGLLKLLKNSQKFLIKTYIVKLNDDMSNGIIDESEYNGKLQTFINGLSRTYDYSDKSYVIRDENKTNERPEMGNLGNRMHIEM